MKTSRSKLDAAECWTRIGRSLAAVGSLRIFGKDGRLDVATYVELTDDPYPAGLEQPEQLFQYLVHRRLMAESAVTKSIDVEIVAAQLHDRLDGHIVDHYSREIRIDSP